MVPQEMREPTLLILTALTEGPQHGYAVMQRVAELSDGRVTLRPGTLYAAIDRLLAEGLLVEAGEEVVDGRLRRYYDVSEDGLLALAAEARRLQANASRAVRGLRMRGVTT